jgi:hypothetical protein
VAAAGGQELLDQVGQWFGEDDRLAPQVQPYLLVVSVDVAEGERADDRGPLGVEQDEEPGDAVFGVEAAVAEQPACLFPAGLGVDDAGRAGPSGGREVLPETHFHRRKRLDIRSAFSEITSVGQGMF